DRCRWGDSPVPPAVQITAPVSLRPRPESPGESLHPHQSSFHAPSEPQTGQEVIHLILPRHHIIPLIGMNLRTFSLRSRFSLLGVWQLMLDTGDAVDLPRHAHQVEQALLDVIDQCDDPLDDLLGEILIILGNENVIEVAGYLGAVLIADLEKVHDATGQVAELLGANFPALKALPDLAQGSRFLTELTDHRRAALHQVHGPV